jgi:hypothetical protein
MDKNLFNNLLSNADTLQTRLTSYGSFKNEHRGKNNSNIPSEITFRDQNGELLASFTLDSNTSHAVLSLLIERTKADLHVTAEMIKNMITEDET